MSKTLKKTIAFILAFTLILSVSSSGVTVLAASETASESLSSEFRTSRTLATFLSTILETLIVAVLSFFPDADWEHIDDHVANTDYKGSPEFSDEAADGAVWKAGYGSSSIVPDDVASGKYTSAGYNSNLPANYMNGVLDDQSFRVVALSAGDEITLFCSLDAFGFTGTNVKALREYLSDAFEGYNVVSVNITSSHTHYGLDVHGLGTNIYDILYKNVKFALTRKTEVINSVNQDLLDHMFLRAKVAVVEALDDMREGSLQYGEIYAGDLMHDKQNPVVFDENINQIKFVPNDDSNEIWLVNMGVHPTTLPSSTTEVSADYPGAIVKYAKEKANANVAFYQGAQAAISRDMSGLATEGLTSYETMLLYGEEIVDRILANNEYTDLDPILNIYHKEVFFSVTNAVLHLVCKFQIANNECIKVSNRFTQNLCVSEIGYAELGKDLAIFLFPGEISPEIVFGGTKPANIAWNGYDWPYEPLANLAGGRKVIAFGLTNDQIGYVVPDNDYAPTFADTIAGDSFGDNNKHYEELISLGRNTASELAEHYIGLFADIVRY